ncbi:hypothetical protein OE88DRAFT_38508 [Heliocybe sulcata]|uniref:Uncharacterized protein n=1 Tax=Heliocybe sulcata TaxID=5364 RepID=A0A5C3NGY4_9AGAM|nr:hypothetical protein OE88DRAFT_38508 [Heliocybe sulcata]
MRQPSLSSWMRPASLLRTLRLARADVAAQPQIARYYSDEATQEPTQNKPNAPPRRVRARVASSFKSISKGTARRLSPSALPTGEWKADPRFSPTLNSAGSSTFASRLTERQRETDPTIFTDPRHRGLRGPSGASNSPFQRRSEVEPRLNQLADDRPSGASNTRFPRRSEAKSRWNDSDITGHPERQTHASRNAQRSNLAGNDSQMRGHRERQTHASKDAQKSNLAGTNSQMTGHPEHERLRFPERSEVESGWKRLADQMSSQASNSRFQRRSKLEGDGSQMTGHLHQER